VNDLLIKLAHALDVDRDLLLVRLFIGDFVLVAIGLLMLFFAKKKIVGLVAIAVGVVIFVFLFSTGDFSKLDFKDFGIGSLKG
jgi:hypothetical protein